MIGCAGTDSHPFGGVFIDHLHVVRWLVQEVILAVDWHFCSTAHCRHSRIALRLVVSDESHGFDVQKRLHRLVLIKLSTRLRKPAGVSLGQILLDEATRYFALGDV